MRQSWKELREAGTKTDEAFQALAREFNIGRSQVSKIVYGIVP
ncbi:MAG: hypothetical protein P1V51_19800 [Deltaproteobacteria bacterium]|nr:hypothetical protein [Deltaproteobacteria bacterium]